jgi:phage terminase small subunit
LTGTFKRSRHANRADARLGGLESSDPPTWLADSAKPYWSKLLPVIAHGVMSEAHKTSLAMLCTALADFDALNQLQAKTRGDAALKIIVRKGKVYDTVLRYLREFGLTPAAAASIKLPNNDIGSETENEATAFFGPKLAG